MTRSKQTVWIVIINLLLKIRKTRPKAHKKKKMTWLCSKMLPWEVTMTLIVREVVMVDLMLKVRKMETSFTLMIMKWPSSKPWLTKRRLKPKLRSTMTLRLTKRATLQREKSMRMAMSYS